MPAVAVVTLVLAGLILGAAVLGLVRVILHLAAVRQTLGTVVVGIAVVAAQTRATTVIGHETLSAGPVAAESQSGEQPREQAASLRRTGDRAPMSP